jgi:hypothetical protein
VARSRRRMVEDRVERALVGGPGVEVPSTPSASRELPQDPHGRARLARRLQHLRHQVEVRVRALAAELLEPRRPGSTTSANRRAVSFRKRSWLTTRSVPREARRQRAASAIRGQHVGPEEQHDRARGRRRAPSVTRGHLVRHVRARRATLGHRDVESAWPWLAAPWRGPSPPPALPRLPVERRQATRSRAPPCHPLPPLCIELPPTRTHRGARRRVAAREAAMRSAGTPGDGRRPLGPERRTWAGQGVEARPCGARRTPRREDPPRR